MTRMPVKAALAVILLTSFSLGILPARAQSKSTDADSAAIRQVVPHDFATLELHDPENNQFRLQILDAAYGKDAHVKETVVPA